MLANTYTDTSIIVLSPWPDESHEFVTIFIAGIITQSPRPEATTVCALRKAHTHTHSRTKPISRAVLLHKSIRRERKNMRRYRCSSWVKPKDRPSGETMSKWIFDYEQASGLSASPISPTALYYCEQQI